MLGGLKVEEEEEVVLNSFVRKLSATVPGRVIGGRRKKPKMFFHLRSTPFVRI